MANSISKVCGDDINNYDNVINQFEDLHDIFRDPVDYFRNKGAKKIIGITGLDDFNKSKKFKGTESVKPLLAFMT